MQHCPCNFLSIPRDLKAHAEVKVAIKDNGIDFVVKSARITLPAISYRGLAKWEGESEGTY